MLQTLRKPGLRIWNHRVADVAVKEQQDIAYEKVGVNKELDKARLSELTLIINTKGKYQGEGEGANSEAGPQINPESPVK